MGYEPLMERKRGQDLEERHGDIRLIISRPVAPGDGGLSFSESSERRPVPRQVLFANDFHNRRQGVWSPPLI